MNVDEFCSSIEQVFLDLLELCSRQLSFGANIRQYLQQKDWAQLQVELSAFEESVQQVNNLEIKRLDLMQDLMGQDFADLNFSAILLQLPMEKREKLSPIFIKLRSSYSRVKNEMGVIMSFAQKKSNMLHDFIEVLQDSEESGTYGKAGSYKNQEVSPVLVNSQI